MLLAAHKENFGSKKPSIALVAEMETLKRVGENLHFVEYLNGLPDVSAYLVSPEKLKLKKDQIYVGSNKITVIYLDLNNNDIATLKKKYNLQPLIKAIKGGIVVNPRGMEPIGSKGIFEAIILEYRNFMNQTTVKRTPWTRLFFPRSTTGPDGENIPDLISWTKKNWSDIILKPMHGHSGKGIIIGNSETRRGECIRQALSSGDYVIQSFIPMRLWAEEFPWIDDDNKRLFIKTWQTDFRCFISDKGLIGFATRFGGIPTNVGSGGGAHSTAILRSKISIKDAIKKINEAILSLGFNFIEQLQEEVDRKSIQMGNIYVLGPVKSTLRPRIINLDLLSDLQIYSKNLWDDAKKLEALWLDGKLTRYVQLSKEEKEIARLAPWRGSPALIGSDGLFNFRGSL
jgi:hypothetical protein